MGWFAVQIVPHPTEVAGALGQAQKRDAFSVSAGVAPCGNCSEAAPCITASVAVAPASDTGHQVPMKFATPQLPQAA